MKSKPSSLLLKNILKESPDKIILGDESSLGYNRSDPKRLKSLGADIPQQSGEVHWLKDSTYAFFFDLKNNVIIYTEKNTHGDIERVLHSAAKDAKLYPKTFKRKYLIKRDMFDNITILSFKDNNIDFLDDVTIGFIGLNNKGEDDATIVDYISKNARYFRNLDIRGNGDQSEANEMSGRIWAKKNLISFWNNKENVMKNFSLVDKMMSSMKVNKTKVAYEFLDVEGLFAYSELGDNTREKLSSAEMQAKLAQKHLKKDKEDYDTQFWRRGAAKGAKGFDYAAQASAAIPARESNIKLKSVAQKIVEENNKML